MSIKGLPADWKSNETEGPCWAESTRSGEKYTWVPASRTLQQHWTVGCPAGKGGRFSIFSGKERGILPSFLTMRFTMWYIKRYTFGSFFAVTHVSCRSDITALMDPFFSARLS